MKYLSKLILVFVLSIIRLFGQAPDTAWARTYGGNNGDYGYSVQQTSDGGYIVAGYTLSYGAGGDDVYLMKTNSSGDTLWTSTFGDEYSDVGQSVQQTADDGYILTGATNSYDPEWGAYDIYLLKSDADGNEDWHKVIRYDQDLPGTEEWANSVKTTSDGGYVLAGEINDYDPDKWNEALLIKTDANGNVLWKKLFGGSGRDGAKSVQQTTDGGYIIAGFTGSFGVELRDVYLIKTDAGGNQVWSKTFGGSGYDGATSVCQTFDGGYIIAGYLNSLDIYLIKTDANGNEVWSKTFGGEQVDIAHSVQQTSDGGYIIAGFTESYAEGGEDVYLIKTDSDGNEVWSKTFGGPDDDCGYLVQQTSDGGYIIAGYKGSYGATKDDVYLIKVKPDGSGIDEEITAGSFSLSPAGPNPFTTKTSFIYELPGETDVNISVYNLFGQKVRDLYSGRQYSGVHFVDWDGMGDSGEKLSSGIYFLRVETEEREASTKVMFVR
jgi:hypothetical protein